VLLIPSLLAGAMLATALVLTSIAKVEFSGLFAPYFLASIAITIVSLLGSVFWWVIQLARIRADNPVAAIRMRLASRWALLLLPVVVFPLFLVGFTAAKTSIPFIVGYSWDAFWADADRFLFGDDVWRLTQHWFGQRSMAVWEWFYTVSWGLTLIFASALVALHAPRRGVGVFYAAMMSTWLIGGVLLAYLFSAAGPVFAHLWSPELAARFAPLRESLGQNLSQHGTIGLTQHYLASAVTSHVAVKGGGISAMPSMHLGAASIYVLAAWRTRWLIPAALFWIIIFVASGYFGYHYWIDGIVAAAVASLCWFGARRYYEPRKLRHA